MPFARSVRATHSVPNASQEIDHLLRSLPSQDPFLSIRGILDFSQKTQILITEDHVHAHLPYFSGLLHDLKAAIVSSDDVAFTDVLNAVQFSFVMNFDDEGLWAGLSRALEAGLEGASVKDGVKVLSVLENVQTTEGLLSKEQVDSLRRKAVAVIGNALQNSQKDELSGKDLIEVLSLVLKYLPHEGEVLERFDEALSERIAEGSLSRDLFCSLMETLSLHNQECPAGDEVTLQLVCLEGESFVQSNLTFMDKSEFLNTIGGYATSGVLPQLPALQAQFESEVKQRLQTLALEELAFLVRLFASAGSASPEFYALADRAIGLQTGTDVEPHLIFSILKAFYDSGHARPKLFIKLQQAVIKVMDRLPVNELAAVVRLYVEMDVQQASFYEQVARNLERRLSEISEDGLLNALIAFKQCSTHKQMSIVTDLERILLGNIGALQIQSLSQVLYTYSRVGDDSRKNRKLTDTVLNQLLVGLESGMELSPADIFQTVIALSKEEGSERVLEGLRIALRNLPEAVGAYQDTELNMLFSLVSEWQGKHEGFDEAFAAVRDEVRLRQSQGDGRGGAGEGMPY